MSRRSSAIVGAAAALLGACSQGSPAPKPAQPAPAIQPPLTVGPVSFFEQKCARCHGPYGELYPRPFVAHIDADLARIVREMVTGPAQTTLPERELDAMTDYHRSMAAAAPFIVITARDGTHLAGEVSPGSTVTIRAGTQTLAARVDGHAWSIDLPSGFSAAYEIEATRDGRTATLDPVQRPWSAP